MSKVALTDPQQPPKLPHPAGSFELWKLFNQRELEQLRKKEQAELIRKLRQLP